ncbi:hypothetical protein BST61_g8833 [Cercospora zeina]
MVVQVGKPAPAFHCTAVVDGKLKNISLEGYTSANHWLILIFFPKAWSFICPTEIRAFSSRLEEFLYARSCAVRWKAGSVVLVEEEGVAQRALFIIDPKGRIRNITVNDTDVGRSVDEAVRILDALIFKDEFGEGCPVDWKKGDKGLDYKAETTIEGAVEVSKKSWSEWARPKLQRAWSGASGISTLSNTPPTSRPTYDRSISHSGSHSPLYSPGARGSHVSLGTQMEEALVQQRMENLNAAMQNQSVGKSVGMAV